MLRFLTFFLLVWSQLLPCDALTDVYLCNRKRDRCGAVLAMVKE